MHPCDDVAGNYDADIAPIGTEVPQDFSILAGPDANFPVAQANHVTVVRAPGSLTVTYFQNDRVKQVVGVKLQLKSAFGYAKPGMPSDGEILVQGDTWPKHKVVQ